MDQKPYPHKRSNFQLPKDDGHTFTLKPYLRKRRHVSYRPIAISPKVLNNNPYPTYGPEGVILPPSFASDLHSTSNRQLGLVRDKLAQLSAEKRPIITTGELEGKRIKLIDASPCLGQPTIISHRIAPGITGSEAETSFEAQVRHLKGSAISVQRRKWLEKRLQALRDHYAK